MGAERERLTNTLSVRLRIADNSRLAEAMKV